MHIFFYKNKKNRLLVGFSPFGDFMQILCCNYELDAVLYFLLVAASTIASATSRIDLRLLILYCCIRR